MNKILISLLFYSILSSFAQDSRFFDVLGKLESNNNPKAIGDNGLAIGIYQIHRNYFIDATDFDRNLKKYKYNDCFNPEIAKLVVTSYLARYCRNSTYYDMARCHNSGPGWKNKIDLTNRYVGKFKEIELTRPNK